MQLDYSKYSNLHELIFTQVRSAFHRNGFLSTEDFFCIIIWKANRAKSKIASKLLSLSKDLDTAVADLSQGIYKAETDRAKLTVLLKDWELRLPMASAILTVLYPDRFTIYDYRVCEQIGAFKHLQSRNLEGILDGYEDYKKDVISKSPHGLSLRECDKYLWGKSFYEQLHDDIKRNFVKENS